MPRNLKIHDKNGNYDKLHDLFFKGRADIE